MLGVCDPCTLEAHPGWPLRNLLTLAAYHWYGFHEPYFHLKNQITVVHTSSHKKVTFPLLKRSLPLVFCLKNTYQE